MTQVFEVIGAGEGNRTLVISLEGPDVMAVTKSSTAKTLGLTVPDKLLVAADEVIE